ncbi:hypothetical protein CHS0354_019679 [Potamilus streckersoni]|uniref:Uncharacterized protein n=1 Tax=Potamilus streckersoni TaxID=2493646 RepID=A0AAE0SA41_9BIVA|nr:hypothetical protein CHS0354_019679 [Potamilus streckersoni]
MSDKKKHPFKSFKQKTARLFPRFRKVRKLTKITEEPSLDGSCVQSTVHPFQGETTSEPFVLFKSEVAANIEEYQELKFADDADSEYSEIGGGKYGHATLEELNSTCVGDEGNDLPFPLTPVSRHYELGESKSGSIDSGIDCVLSPTLGNDTSKASLSQETGVKRDAEISASLTTLLEKQELKLSRSQNCEKNRTCSTLSQEDSVKDHEVPDSEISKSSNREFHYNAASESVASSKARESNETTNKHDNTYEEIMVDELVDNSSKSENSSSKSLLNYRPVKDSILLHSPHLLVSPIPRLREYKSTINLESAKTCPVPWELQVNENSAFERTKPTYRSVRNSVKEVCETFQDKEKNFKYSGAVQYGIKDKSHELSDYKNCHETNTVSNKKNDVNLKILQTVNKPHYDVDVSSSLDDSDSSLSSLENIVCCYSSDDSLHLGRVSESESRKQSHSQEDRSRHMFEKQDDSSNERIYAGSIHGCDEPFGLSWNQYMTKPQKSVTKHKDKAENSCLQSENVCRNKSLKRSTNVSDLHGESVTMASSSTASASYRENICKKSRCKSTYHTENAHFSKQGEKTDECHTLNVKETSDFSRRNSHSHQKHALPVWYKQQTSLDDAFLENDMKVDKWKRNSRLYSSLNSSFSDFKGKDHKRKVLDLHNLSVDERGHSKAIQNYYDSFPSAENHEESFPGEQNIPCPDQFRLSTTIRANPMKCNQSNSKVHHYDEFSSRHNQCQNHQAFWIEKKVGMEFSPAKRVLHKNKNMSEKDLCQQILNLYVMDDCQSDSASDLPGQDPVSPPSALDHIYEELLTVDHSRSLQQLDDSLLQYGTYVAPRLQQESNTIDPNHEVYTAEAVKRRLQHGINQGVCKPRPVSTPSGPVEYRIPAKPRPLSTPTEPGEDIMKQMINWQQPSSVPHEKTCSRGLDHQKLDGQENFFEEQFDKLTKFHTVRNGRRMVRYLTLEEAQSIITHFPPPKDPSRISWNEKLVEWDYHHHTPRQTPIKTKPILSQKNTSFPNSDDIPSPIILTKLRRSKSLSRRYKNWPW